MTFWEFGTAVAGWSKANGGGEKVSVTYPTDEEFEDAVRRLH